MKMMNKRKQFGASTVILFALFLLCIIIAGCVYRTSSTHAARLINLDFTPVSGSYNISATGQDLRYADVKFYNLSVQLDNPAPGSFTITYDIKGDEFWSDPLLGKVNVTFNTGATVPGQITYSSFLGDTRKPANAPDATYGRFWLGCTKKKIIRGNAGKGHDSHAPVYLERSNTVFHSGGTYTIGGGQGGRISETHDITCQ